MVIFDITLAAREAVSLLLSPSMRGLLAAGVCAAMAWAVGLALVLVDQIERRYR